MKWFSRPKYTTLTGAAEKRELPPGVWIKCENCHEYLTRSELEHNLMVCPKCDHHFRLTAPERLATLIDPGTFREHDAELESCDPLDFEGYKKKLAISREKTGLREAILSGNATMERIPVVMIVTDFSFVGGSMGSVVGERVTRSMEFALEHRLPVVSVAAGGGGARMQEGALSLMQMAKTSSAVARLHAAGVPYISVFTHPTMGGVAASYASLGDVMLAEPGALIGFAGPRVIEQTIGQRLPSGFQTAEFLLEHGMLDRIVHRSELKPTLVLLLRYMMAGEAAKLEEVRASAAGPPVAAEASLQVVHRAKPA